MLPLDSTEVKSKASGEVMALKVQTGDPVRQGDLLVQIDPRTAQNEVTQAQSDLDVAQAQLATAQSQMTRAQQLFQGQSISQQDYDSANLQLATAGNAVVRAKVALQNAQIAFETPKSAAGVLGLSADEVRRQLASGADTSETTLGGALAGRDGRRRPASPGPEVFGGRYIVFVLRQGKPQAVSIRTGLNNLNDAEVVSGLAEGDTVLLLASASLVAFQQGM